MDENTWETNVTSQIIANEEGLYNAASSLATSVYDIRELADMMESEFYDIIYNYPHSDIDMSLVDWTEIASEYMEDDTEEEEKEEEEKEEDIPLICTCDDCGTCFKEDDLVNEQYAEYPGASMQPMYVSPCCHADYEYTD